MPSTDPPGSAFLERVSYFGQQVSLDDRPDPPAQILRETRDERRRGGLGASSTPGDLEHERFVNPLTDQRSPRRLPCPGQRGI